MSAPLTALVLAGKRDGTLDPLAAAAGVTHKCLVPVFGRAMIEYPLETLSRCEGVGRILVAIDDAAILDGLPFVQGLREAGRLEFVKAELHLVESVVAAARQADFPLLITTADNVLLTEEAVRDCDATGRREQADAVVAFAREEAVKAAHPDGQRRFYKFARGSYSNCNLFWLGSARALATTEVFRSGGQFAKHPKRIVDAFGLSNLILFRLGLLSLDGCFRRLSRRFRLKLRPVVLADGKVAIDVDNERTKGVAEEILARSGPALEAA